MGAQIYLLSIDPTIYQDPNVEDLENLYYDYYNQGGDGDVPGLKSIHTFHGRQNCIEIITVFHYFFEGFGMQAQPAIPGTETGYLLTKAELLGFLDWCTALSMLYNNERPEGYAEHYTSEALKAKADAMFDFLKTGLDMFPARKQITEVSCRYFLWLYSY